MATEVEEASEVEVVLKEADLEEEEVLIEAAVS